MSLSLSNFESCLAEAKASLNKALTVTDCLFCKKQVERVLRILDLIAESSRFASGILEVHKEIAILSSEVRKDARKLKEEK